jgi:hypothetical protein
MKSSYRSLNDRLFVMRGYYMPAFAQRGEKESVFSLKQNTPPHRNIVLIPYLW